MTVKEIVSLPFDPTSTDPYGSFNRGLVPNFVRGSIGSSEDEQGNIMPVGVNTYRFKKVGTKSYLALEQVSTNLLADRSENFCTWTPDGTVAVFAKTQIGPTNDYSADEVVFSATQADGISYTSLGNRNSQQLTFSCWIRAASGTPSVRMRLISNNNYEATKALTTTWTRFSMTQILQAGDTTSLAVKINPNDTSAPTVYVYGAQLEIVDYATTYIPTTPVFIFDRNLVVDGDMELEGTGNWATSGSPTSVLKTKTNARFRRQSTKITCTGDAQGIQQTITTVNGASYKLSFWVYQESGTSNFAAFVGASGTQDLGNAAPVVGSWIYREVVFIASGTSQLLILKSSGAGAAVFYVDRVKVTTQICPEGSLETSTLWATDGTAVIAAETTTIHSGVKSLKVTCAASGDGVHISQTNIAAANTSWYHLSAWVYIVSQSAGNVVPQLAAHANFNITVQKCKSVVGSWQKISSIFKTGTLAGGNTINFQQAAVAGNLVFLVDDVSIVQLTSNTATRIADQLSIELIGRPSSNQLIYSEQFDNAAWIKGDTITVTTNNIAAPDGSTTADLVSFIGPAAQLLQVSAVKASTLYCFSVWLKSDEPKNVDILLYDGIGVNTATVTVTSVWRRFYVTMTTDAAPLYISTYIQPAASGINIQKPFNIWIWGAQLEEGLTPTQYVRTVATTQPVSFSSIGSHNFSKQQGSVSFWGIIPWLASSGVNHAGVIGDQSTAALSIYDSGNTALDDLLFAIRGRDKTGAIVQMTTTLTGSGSLSPTTEHHIAFSWWTDRDNNGKQVASQRKIWIDGKLIASGPYTGIEMWAYDQSSFKISDGFVSSFIRDFKIFTASLTDQDVTDLYTGVYV